jgi:hypothetical protein
VALWLLLVSLSTECSHRSPYRRDVGAPLVDTDAPGELISRLLLIGDAGHAAAGSTVIAALAQRAADNPARTIVLYLGDNIYTAGMPPVDDELRALSERRLLAQIDPLRSVGVEVLFVPGNHDWDNAGPDGLGAVLRQEAFLREKGTDKMRMAPSGAKPGPACLDRPSLRLIALDTQWWLHDFERNVGPSIGERTVLDALDRCLREAHGRHVVVVGHHPLHTNGPHGGFTEFVDHVFPLTRLSRWGYVPLPIIGSAYPMVRSLGVSAQDIDSEANRVMVAALSGVLQAHRPLLYASGHDHSLQVHELQFGPRFHVVSGAGSSTTPVGHDKSTLFAVERLGFIEVDIDRTEVARLRVYAATESGPKRLWERRLGRFGP